MEKIISVIDIGSNTVKLVIYKYKNGKLIPKYTQSIYLRLFNYLIKSNSPHGEKLIISKKGISKTKEVLEHFKKEVDEYKPDKLIAFATYVIRVADNKDEFLNEMKDYFDIRILSEQEEAYYSAYGALLNINLESGIICDMGGGSLEVCSVKNNDIEHCNSYPLGTLYFKDFFPDGILINEEGARNKIRKFIKKPSQNFETMVGVGGSIRALSKITHKKKIEKTVLDKTLNKIKNMTPNEISEKYMISERRSETVVSAALAMSELMNIYGCKTLYISKYGIREGIILKLLLNGEKP
ncbi:Ppx/GppA phosphatase family protein [Methanothermococcus okinawensis]|uniref:Ppx/GppA phosphatase family protein n=1 Tax=Methanothermococcus okinawensis TaxID=155863 RepID=UPI00064E26E3|nr:hypothetical protein [Methanothermococcus okinawensis]